MKRLHPSLREISSKVGSIRAVRHMFNAKRRLSHLVSHSVATLFSYGSSAVEELRQHPIDGLDQSRGFQ